MKRQRSIVAICIALALFVGLTAQAVTRDSMMAIANVQSSPIQAQAVPADKEFLIAEPVLDMGMEGFGASFVAYEQPEPVEEYEEYYEEEYWEPYYYEPTYYPTYDTPTDGLTMQGGVNEYDGRTETWYSSNVLYHYRTNEWTLDSEGFYRDADGYYVVAASDMEQGTVFEGSKGECKVYDCGCADGVTDYYVCWE